MHSSAELRAVMPGIAERMPGSPGHGQARGAVRYHVLLEQGAGSGFSGLYSGHRAPVTGCYVRCDPPNSLRRQRRSDVGELPRTQSACLGPSLPRPGHRRSKLQTAKLALPCGRPWKRRIDLHSQVWLARTFPSIFLDVIVNPKGCPWRNLGSMLESSLSCTLSGRMIHTYV